ncbi:peroxisomal biogenesis factor 11 [Lipomyces oligophaga]|uniref:peroxisomal biogenesis factor 11 n=1 Tax=Lipomyces oligophaga TaxID=45792 RepID=UPI0034CF9086
MVVNAVVYHPTLAHLLRYFDSTVGRDKLMRIVQYFARFYAAYLVRKKTVDPAEISKWRAFMSLVSTARKILRVGKPLQHLKAAGVAFDNKASDAFIRYTAVGRQLAYAGYLTCDFAVLAHSTKLVTLKKPDLIQKLYYRFWLSGIIFSVAGGIYKHVGLYQRDVFLSKQAEKDVVAVKKVQAERAKANTQLALDILDSTIPISGLNLLSIDDGSVGVAGMVSSFIGASEQWKSTA